MFGVGLGNGMGAGLGRGVVGACCESLGFDGVGKVSGTLGRAGTGGYISGVTGGLLLLFVKNTHSSMRINNPWFKLWNVPVLCIVPF